MVPNTTMAGAFDLWSHGGGIMSTSPAVGCRAGPGVVVAVFRGGVAETRVALTASAIWLERFSRMSLKAASKVNAVV